MASSRWICLHICAYPSCLSVWDSHAFLGPQLVHIPALILSMLHLIYTVLIAHGAGLHKQKGHFHTCIWCIWKTFPSSPGLPFLSLSSTCQNSIFPVTSLLLSYNMTYRNQKEKNMMFAFLRLIHFV